jgi:uncharacterized protein
MEPRIPIDHEKIAAFCQKWKIVEFSLFGSVLTDALREDSDVDVMVTFERATLWTLKDLDDMEEELSRTVGRRVDLSTRPSIEHMWNHTRRNSILRGMRVIYAA